MAFLARRWSSRRFPEFPRRAILLAALSGDPDLANGAVPGLRDGPRAQYAVRRRRAAAVVPALALVRGQAHKAPTHPPAHAAQSIDRGQSGRGYRKAGLARAHRVGRDLARASGAGPREQEFRRGASEPMKQGPLERPLCRFNATSGYGPFTAVRPWLSSAFMSAPASKSE